MPKAVLDGLRDIFFAEEKTHVPGAQEQLDILTIRAVERVADAIDAAIYAYRRELELLTLYQPGGSWREKLKAFVDGQLPLEAIPSGLREDIQSRLRRALIPIGHEPFGDVFQVRGDFHDALGSPGLLPEAGHPDHESLRAQQFLVTQLAGGKRIRHREIATRHLLESLWRICYPSQILRAIPQRNFGRGRPKDWMTAQRKLWVLTTLRENNIPEPSARLLREAIPSLSPKMPATTVRQRPGKRSMKWRVGGTLPHPEWFCQDCKSAASIVVVKDKGRQAHWFLKCGCGTFDMDEDEGIKSVWQAWVDGIMNPWRLAGLPPFRPTNHPRTLRDDPEPNE